MLFTIYRNGEPVPGCTSISEEAALKFLRVSRRTLYERAKYDELIRQTWKVTADGPINLRTVRPGRKDKNGMTTEECELFVKRWNNIRRAAGVI